MMLRVPAPPSSRIPFDRRSGCIGPVTSGAGCRMACWSWWDGEMTRSKFAVTGLKSVKSKAGFRDAAVIVDPRNTALAAFVVAETAFDTGELRHWVSQQLPEYMVPHISS